MLYSPKTNSFIQSEIIPYSLLPQLIWVLTDRCPHKCPFCFQPKNNQDFRHDFIDRVVEKLKSLGVQKVDISGGEPLLYAHLDYVCNTLRQSKIYFTITSMGSLSRQELWLQEHHDLFTRVLISVNAGTEQAHDLLTGCSGSYQKVFTLLLKLKNKRCNKIRINTVVTNIFLSECQRWNIVKNITMISPLEWCLIEPNPDNTGPLFAKFSITHGEFSDIFVDINSKLQNLNSTVILLKRTIDDYSDYWVLNPDGTLFKHAKRNCSVGMFHNILQSDIETKISELQ